MPSAVDHLEAALSRLDPEELRTLAPARRRRLRETLGCYAYILDHWEREAQKAKKPRSGVLGALKDGERAP